MGLTAVPMCAGGRVSRGKCLEIRVSHSLRERRRWRRADREDGEENAIPSGLVDRPFVQKRRYDLAASENDQLCKFAPALANYGSTPPTVVRPVPLQPSTPNRMNFWMRFPVSTSAV
jgi:hypothetical protein